MGCAARVNRCMGVCEQADADWRIHTSALLLCGCFFQDESEPLLRVRLVFFGFGLFLLESPGASGPEVLPASWLIRTGQADQQHPQAAPLTEQGRVELYTWMLDLDFFSFSGPV